MARRIAQKLNIKWKHIDSKKINITKAASKHYFEQGFLNYQVHSKIICHLKRQLGS